MLVSVFDALALIRLRRTLFANFGCELTYLLLVGTGNYDFIDTSIPPSARKSGLRERFFAF